MHDKRTFFTDGRIAIILILVLLLIDQTSKILVKTNFCLGESIHVTDWFYIHFVENNGMAYGLTIINKLFLSVFRIVALGVIGWYIHKVLRDRHSTRYVLFLSMIFAGAAGNIIDSMFYGLIFEPSTPISVAGLMPWGDGYAGFLMGKVVDMLYFPLVVGKYPEWVPMRGGEDFIFFSPVFNFADSCITVGVVCIILFCRKDLQHKTACIDDENSN